jgi:hypothetical protein
VCVLSVCISAFHILQFTRFTQQDFFPCFPFPSNRPPSDTVPTCWVLMASMILMTSMYLPHMRAYPLCRGCSLRLSESSFPFVGVAAVAAAKNKQSWPARPISLLRRISKSPGLNLCSTQCSSSPPSRNLSFRSRKKERGRPYPLC